MKKSKKKIPAFWKVYIFTVTAIVLLSGVFFIFLRGYLRGYEETASAERAAQSAEAAAREKEREENEAKRIFEERDSAEREAAGLLSRRAAVLDAVKTASDAGYGIAELSLGVTAAQTAERFAAELASKGASAFSDIINCPVGKYELKENVYKYLDSLEGGYVLSRTGDLTFSVTRGDVTGTLTLTEQRDEKGHRTYSAGKVDLSIPLSTYKLQAPENAAVTANGIKIDDKPRLTPVTVPSFVPKSFNVPAAAEYELGGFIYRPALSAQVDGVDCRVIRYPDETVFLTPSSGTYENELHDTLFKLCGKYSDFVAGVFNFSTLKQYLWSGTKLYDTLSTFDNRWYYNYDHIGNGNEKITDFVVYSEDLVSFHIEYTQYLYAADNSIRFRISIKIDVFAGRDASNGKWYLINVET